MKIADFPSNKIFEVSPSDVTIPSDRQRKDLGDLSDLKDSILEVGQIQPIVISFVDSGDDLEYEHVLVVGNRRLQACRELEIQVQAVYWHDLTNFQRAKIEFDENMHRKDLSWHERDAAEKRLVLIAADLGVSMRKVAEEMDVSQGGISDRVAMAEAVEMFPQLRECKSRAEAAKTLKNLVAQELINEQMRREKEKADAVIRKPDQLDVSIFEKKMHLGRFMDDSLGTAGGSADIVIFDPPFGIELHEVKQQDYTSEASQRSEGIYQDDRDTFKGEFPKWIAEIHRLMADNAHLWCFFGVEWYQFVCDTLAEQGLNYDKIPYIWYKTATTGQTNNPNFYGGRVYETFIFVWKGHQPLARRGLPNVVEAPPIPPSDKIHETEKPVLLLDNIIRRSYWPGATILDPMYGSGSTFRAAMGLGTTKFFGWEISKEKRDRAVLKSLAHARNILETPGFSLTHYDSVERTADSEYSAGQRVRWKRQTGEMAEGTIREVDTQYKKLLVQPDDPKLGWNRKQHPEGPPAERRYPVPFPKIEEVWNEET